MTNADVWIGGKRFATLNDVEWESPGFMTGKVVPVTGVPLIGAYERLLDSRVEIDGVEGRVCGLSISGGRAKQTTVTARFFVGCAIYGSLLGPAQGFTLTPGQLRRWKRRG